MKHDYAEETRKAEGLTQELADSQERRGYLEEINQSLKDQVAALTNQMREKEEIHNGVIQAKQAEVGNWFVLRF